MAEKHLWATLRDALKPYGHFDRIENMVGRGRPDVNYCVRGCSGDIELKQLPAWPAHSDTVVKVDHFSPQQRLWLRQRCAAGGTVFVLLEVVKPTPVYLLLRGAWARLHLGLTATQQQLRDAAVVTGDGRFPTKDILTELWRHA